VASAGGFMPFPSPGRSGSVRGTRPGSSRQHGGR
jgi:hypothetical protein